MKSLVGGIRKVSKVWLFAALIAITTVALAQESRPASASHTEILFSRSNVMPIRESVIVLNIGAPPLNLYIWAKDVDNSLGVGAFGIDLAYMSWLMSVNSLAADATWLLSTGRNAPIPPCILAVVQPNLGTGGGRAFVSCNTLSPPPPFGPSCSNGHCDGLLGSVTVEAGLVPAITTLRLTDSTLLVDTGQVVSGTVVSPAEVPATRRSVQMIISRCADFDGNGVVNLDDIFAVAFRFGQRSTDPEWDPIHDLDDNNIINLDDIFTTAFQFGTRCPA